MSWKSTPFGHGGVGLAKPVPKGLGPKAYKKRCKSRLFMTVWVTESGVIPDKPVKQGAIRDPVPTPVTPDSDPGSRRL